MSPMFLRRADNLLRIGKEAGLQRPTMGHFLMPRCLLDQFETARLTQSLVLDDHGASLNVAAAFSAAEASALAKPGDPLAAASLHFRRPHPDGMRAGVVTPTSTFRVFGVGKVTPASLGRNARPGFHSSA